MCGIWGFVSEKGAGPDLARILKIVEQTETRGVDAFGMAWIDGRGRLHAYRRQGRLTKWHGCLKWLGDARMIIGHARAATHGEPDENINNHPHAADGGWIVHNGVIRNYETILRARMLVSLVSECDSEVLARLIEDEEGDWAQRCMNAVNEVDPLAPLALLGLWSRPGTLVALRRGNPLHMGRTENGWYLGSLRGGLPVGAVELAPGELLSFTHNRKQEVLCDVRDIREVESAESALDG